VACLWHKLRRKLFSRSDYDLTAEIMGSSFIAFDTELTGLDYGRDAILSIGAIRMEQGMILPDQCFYRLVQPKAELRPETVVIHGITHSDLVQAEPLGLVLADFGEFVNGAVLVGHFVHIDLNFVNRDLKKMQKGRLDNPAVDTGVLHDWLYENDNSFARHHRGMTTKGDLFSLAKRYGVELKQAHNAFDDAFIVAQRFQRFLPFLPGCGVRNLRELLAVARP